MDYELMQVHQEGLLEVGPLDFVGVGQGRCIIVDEKQIAIFRLRDGSVFALDNICPHRAGPLSDGIIGFDLTSQLEAVVCPFHAYKFALSDGRGLDTELHVRTYPVEVRNGHIFLRLI